MNRKTFLLLIAAIMLPFKRLWAWWSPKKPRGLRFQTHNFEKGFLPDGRECYLPRGLFQDAACTIPACKPSDLIGGWKDFNDEQAAHINGPASLEFSQAPDGIWKPAITFSGEDHGVRGNT